MVGAGALGCEYIKMFSLIGLGSGPEGLVSVTDDDNIEISNLNRQFLFRKHNVGHNKAAVATSVGAGLNTVVKFKSYTLRVGKENEPVFHDQFWEGLNLVINAVDNVHARRYIDYQCCYYQKPLFESGTLGTKCNSQLILPNQTQSYSESQDPPEETIPLCTLKNFPYQIEHTIQWARDYFQGVFADGSIECIKYLENQRNISERQMQNQETNQECQDQDYKQSRTPTYEKCVELSRNIFEDVFHNQIIQLLYCFPLEHRTEEGQIFWSNPKRPPTALKFDINDETHLELVQSGANIYAHMYKLPYEHDKAKVREIIKNVKVEEFQLRNVTIKANEKDTKEEKAEDDEQIIEQLSKDLSELQITQRQLNEIVFEKDDPTNWHIEFLAAVANLRARNYKIKEVPPFTVKLIAGKIIPALATTTAMIVGAVGIEIFKYIQGKEVEKMRNSFINLALPLFLFSEPLPPGKHEDQANNVIYLGPTKAIPPKWTAWDRITVTGNKTIAEFLQYFKQTYDVVVNFNNLLNSKLEVAYVKAVGQPLPPYRRFLDLTVGGDIDVNGVDTNADFAPVKYQYQ
ncbi:hypothetical protein pb186bvf_013275 [Paramecium bursaria]